MTGMACSKSLHLAPSNGTTRAYKMPAVFAQDVFIDGSITTQHVTDEAQIRWRKKITTQSKRRFSGVIRSHFEDFRRR